MWNIAWEQHVNQRYLAWGNTGDWLIEMIPLGPECRELLLPYSDDIGRCDGSSPQRHAKGFLPQLAEALQRTHSLASLDIQIERSCRHASHFHSRDWLCPIGQIARLFVVGWGSFRIHGLVPPGLLIGSSSLQFKTIVLVVAGLACVNNCSGLVEMFSCRSLLLF